MTSPIFVYVTLFIGISLLLCTIFYFKFGRELLKARASGVPVKFIELIALELRKIPLDVIIDARIKAANNGINISIDYLSTHHLAGGDVHMVMQGLLKAKEKNIDLSFDHACALDLALKGHKETVELLIAEGWYVNAKDADGVTPLDFAKRHPEIADLLRKLRPPTQIES